MSEPLETIPQGHMTLAFNMKSSADCEAAKLTFATLNTELYRGADATGIIHYCRFIELNGVVYLLGDFDGGLENVLGEMAKHLGPVLEPLLIHVVDAPPVPIAQNAAAFVSWAQDNCLKAMTEYAACPGATVVKIKAAASAAGIVIEEYSGQQLALLPIMPMKGRLSVLAIEAAFNILYRYLKAGGDAVGTVHFVHLVEFPGDLIGFFTVYDGPWEKYLQDFADQLGPAFDLLFKFTKTSPPSPTSKHAAEFSKWVFDHELKPLAFYAAYPGLQVQDLKALLPCS